MKGILMKPDMQKAIVDLRKTQTRRTGKPRYNVGETVYIKEVHYQYGYWVPTPGKTNKGKQIWSFLALRDDVLFEKPSQGYAVYKTNRGWHKRTPLFMPAWAARYIILITGRKHQRLQEITEADVVAEGMEIFGWEYAATDDGSGDMFFYWEPPDYKTRMPAWAYWATSCECATSIYESYWDSINPKQPWESNPEVWKYTFELEALICQKK